MTVPARRAATSSPGNGVIVSNATTTPLNTVLSDLPAFCDRLAS